jgi:hypothetical protein
MASLPSDKISAGHSDPVILTKEGRWRWVPATASRDPIIINTAALKAARLVKKQEAKQSRKGKPARSERLP